MCLFRRAITIPQNYLPIFAKDGGIWTAGVSVFFFREDLALNHPKVFTQDHVHSFQRLARVIDSGGSSYHTWIVPQAADAMVLNSI
jgi:hypothetical protein